MGQMKSLFLYNGVGGTVVAGLVLFDDNELVSFDDNVLVSFILENLKYYKYWYTSHTVSHTLSLSHSL